MDAQTVSLLFALLRSAIRGDRLAEDELAALTEERQRTLYALANKHDVAPLVAAALENHGLLDAPTEVANSFSKQIHLAVYRYARLEYDLEALCDALEAAEIPFIPLKGSVLRNDYPEPWMRTSCDLDILVRDADADRVADLLVQQCGYKTEGKGRHDISLYSPCGNHVEIHYDLIEPGMLDVSLDILHAVWDFTVPHEGCRYRRDMTDDMFYFYHLVHMAKHFVQGGCGIRPLVDLWILDHKDGIDLSRREALIQRGELKAYADAVHRLTAVWFDGQPYDDLTRRMECFILTGGVYGNSENRVTMQQQKQGGRLKYALSKIFLPYEILRFHYPILQKHRWLTPVMEVRRWGKLIFCGGAGRSVRELETTARVSENQAADIKWLLENIGL